MNRSPAGLVYVVVLNWNGWRDTLKCIESLYLSDYGNFQLVVVDNASTDESISRISQEYPEVLVLQSPENKGYSGGNNIGIKHALAHGADYVWVLNNDTTVKSNCLSRMVDVARSDPEVGAVGSIILQQGGSEKIQAWGGGNVDFIFGRSFHATSESDIDYITGASILIAKSALQDVGLFDENSFFMYWEDADLGFRLKKSGWIIKVAGGAIVYHKVSASIGVGSPEMIKYFNCSSVKFFQRHAAMPYIPILIGGAARMAKQLLRGNVHNLKMVYSGMKQGWCGASFDSR